MCNAGEIVDGVVMWEEKEEVEGVGRGRLREGGLLFVGLH